MQSPSSGQALPSEQAVPFYNPAMGMARDLSVLALASWEGRPLRRGLDGLCGTGARGVRWLLEAGVERVQFNDWNPSALDVVRRNLEANGVADRAEVTRSNLNVLLWQELWDAVDVDPFGSPAIFTDAAARAVTNRGVLALTCTDTAALAGTSPKAAYRRYLARPDRSPFLHETSLRIVAGFAVRTAAKHDRALVPVLAHASDHYVRVYLEAQRGAGRADEALKSIGVAWRCRRCGEQGVAPEVPCACPGCPAPREDLAYAGPLWTGPLHDAGLVARMRERAESVDTPLARKEDARKLLDVLAEEADAPPLFHDLHAVASRIGEGAPAMQAVRATLLDRGYRVARTHSLAWGIRTDAPARVLEEAVREANRRRAAATA